MCVCVCLGPYFNVCEWEIKNVHCFPDFLYCYNSFSTLSVLNDVLVGCVRTKNYCSRPVLNPGNSELHHCVEQSGTLRRLCGSIFHKEPRAAKISHPLPLPLKHTDTLCWLSPIFNSACPATSLCTSLHQLHHHHLTPKFSI